MRGESDQRVLVLAPVGRDGELTAAALQKAGITALACRTVDDLCSCLEEGAGVVIIAEEALTESAVECISDVLNDLPDWSDLPFVILTSNGRSTELTLTHLQSMQRLGNITLLERPLRIVTMVTAARAGLRSRQRQYELRDRIEALKTSEARFRSAFDHAAVGMSMLSAEGRFLEVNAALADITGYTQQDLTRCSFGEVTHPEDRTHSERLMSQLGSGDIPYLTHEQRLLRLTGDAVWVRISAAAIPNDSKKEIICLVEEITYRRHAEEALAAQAAELANSNADLQQFAWVTSHDLREPIRALISFSQLLLLRYHGELDQEAKQALQFIVNSAKRMELLVGDLLTYSRVVNVKDRPLARVSLGAALDWAMANLQVSIVDSEAVIHRDPLPDVLGDEVQIVQLLQNLLSNSIKYKGEKAPEIRVTARRENEDYVICFEDNGVGIESRYHERIFGLFKRLHGSEIQGTGLGLAICRKIVERHGGTIWVESEPGKGSNFCFTLKAADPAPS